MKNILIFAGTTEGRKLAEAAQTAEADCHFFVSVATEYGRDLLPAQNSHVTVLAKRMTGHEMKDFIQSNGIRMTVDATHPYAAVVSENIRSACCETGSKYVRLLRETTSLDSSYKIVPHTQAAVEYLKSTKGKVLLTTGSKELQSYTVLPDYESRLYPRILPSPEMTAKAFDLGFDGAHLICMQGPFSYDMNLAMLKQTGASILVTKESGRAGGFGEKLAAAEAAGVQVLIIGRPSAEAGYSLSQVMELCGISEPKNKEKPRWFPLFTDLKGKHVIIIGGGKIAGRRIKTLVQFECQVTVIAPQGESWLDKYEKEGLLCWDKKPYTIGDIKGADLVLAATNSRELNQKIGEESKGLGIPVNVADCKEECDFYFPGIVISGDLVAGVTAGGKNHSLAAKGKGAVLQAWKQMEG